MEVGIAAGGSKLASPLVTSLRGVTHFPALGAAWHPTLQYALPKTSTGRIQKFVLREHEWTDREKRIHR